MSTPASIITTRLLDDTLPALQREVNFFLKWGYLVVDLVFAKLGQAMIFDGWLFQRGGDNVSDSNQRVCLMQYQNAWMKSRENFDSPRIKKLREEGLPEPQMLLGGITSW